MQRRLVLDVDSVDVDFTDVDQELDQLRALDGVDETSSAEVVGPVNVGTGANQALHDVLEIIKSFRNFHENLIKDRINNTFSPQSVRCQRRVQAPIL